MIKLVSVTKPIYFISQIIDFMSNSAQSLLAQKIWQFSSDKITFDKVNLVYKNIFHISVEKTIFDKTILQWLLCHSSIGRIFSIKPLWFYVTGPYKATPRAFSNFCSSSVLIFLVNKKTLWNGFYVIAPQEATFVDNNIFHIWKIFLCHSSIDNIYNIVGSTP